MTKVIAVIELDDEWLDRINTTCAEMIADVTLYKKESLEHQCDYSQRIYRCWCPVKPMPKKSCYSPFQSDVGIVKLNNAFIDGYNACIDEILGGEE